jgi:amidohydrolase
MSNTGNDIIKRVKELADRFYPDALEIRRHLHRYPELSFMEYNTSEYIASMLNRAGIPCRTGVARTGIIGRLEGISPGKGTIALRAELDALPVREETGKPYASVNEGVMHACGHDVHAACLLGASMILNEIKDSFEGTVLFIFQPGEEKAPGGARLMLDEGALDNPVPDLMIAQHVLPSLPVGTLGFKPGIYMASSDEIYIRITGKGGHAALPHQTTDVILIASHIIVALQQIVSRHAEASVPTVLSFGKMEAPGAVNVIPSYVSLEGTFRTMNEAWRKEALQKIKTITHSVAEGMGAGCEVTIVPGYPALVNDPGATSLVRGYASDFLGEENIRSVDIRMTAEDFAFYSERCPVVFYRLGVKNEKIMAPAELHTPAFDIDEEAIRTGMGAMAYIACSFPGKL